MIEDLKFSESLAHCEYLRDRGFVKLLDVSDRDGSDYIVSRTPGGDVFFQDGGCRKESAHEAIKGAFGIAKVLLALISGIILIYIPWQALQYQRKQDQREEARRDFENRLEGRDSTIDVLNVQIDQLKDSLAYLKIQRLIVDAKTQTNATKRIE
ncbi:hypothetical protein [Dyadobacter alkalitolerans]|uniref:hypothetical protein n=1 Tax=Dyadobacter alkalitolerans TaxID=492736 RepID=UPI001B7FB45D|nr:hypothetical protein [Dyadobacter alkalitolerans]